MSTKKYGKVGWDDSNVGSNKNNFLSLAVGPNQVRLISAAYKYLIHKVKFDGDTNKFGRDIRCAINDCPLCKTGDPVKSKYVASVLVGSSKEGYEVKLLDMGPLLYNKIKGIKVNMVGYEEPKDYDMNIIKDLKGGAQNFYQAYPMGKIPLTAEQISVVENKFDEDDLEKFCEPLEPAQVITAIERIKSYISNNNPNPSEKEEKVQATSVVSDDDYDFSVKRS